MNVKILLVEDDDIDAEAILRSLTKIVPKDKILRAKNGQEALDILAEKKTPITSFLIILDLNMPKMGGMEFLENIRSNPSTSSAIVFVLTTSNDEKDHELCYKYNVAGYVLKEKVGKDHYTNITDVIKFYLKYVEFPQEEQL